MTAYTFLAHREATAELDGAGRLAAFEALPIADQDAAWRGLRERIETGRQVREREEAFWRGENLPEKPAPRSEGRFTRRRVEPAYELDDPLAEIPPPIYFEGLAGTQVPDTGGTVLCPLHEERTPSCQVYAEPERGWVCFGCQRGGTIYDLGAALWSIEPRGSGFKMLQERIAQTLLNAPLAGAA